MPFLIIVFLFIVVPLVEIFFFVQIGKRVGAWNTILFIFITGVLGAWLAKSQGTQVLQSIKYQLSKKKIPASELISGLLIFIGGLMLLTPGFLTDVIGFSLVFPLTRLFYAQFVKLIFVKLMGAGKFSILWGGLEGFNKGRGDSINSDKRSSGQKNGEPSKAKTSFDNNDPDVIDVKAERIE